jgi:predicted NBD/HSP70 family sugar kinase
MYLGVDVGGTKTLVACLNEHGVIQEQAKFPTPSVYGVFLRELAKTIVTFSTKEFVAAGVALPGKVDRGRGVGLVFGNLPWHDVPVKVDLEKMFHCPVALDNDANLAGLSEAMLLKDTFNRVLYVTVGTGIGTGIIFNQVIEPAFADSEGGELLLDHGGKLERWQDFASGKAIVRRFGKRAADITDPKVWKTIAHDLALGLAELITIAQPDVIVLGGGVDKYFDRFGALLVAELQRYETPLVPIPPVKRAARPDEAVVYGCYDLIKATYGKANS